MFSKRPLALAAACLTMATAVTVTAAPAASANAQVSCGTTNVALNRTGVASSSDPLYPPRNAFDGNPHTRWASGFGSPQWITADLGLSRSVCRVVLNWAPAFGQAFQLQTSSNGVTWTPIFATTTGTGGVQTLDVLGTGRFVRMLGTQAGTPFGFSLWEFEVYAAGS